MKAAGKLEQSDLGPGVWTLVADDGRKMTLSGDIPPGLAGKRVQIEGEESEMMGIGMTGGAIVEVHSIKRA